MPVYKCERKGQDPRIVEAPNPGAARQHVAKTEITVTKIGTSEAFDHSNRGLKLEIAGQIQPSPDDETPRAPAEIGQVGGAQQPEIEEEGTAE